jgi:hypothetical protein
MLDFPSSPSTGQTYAAGITTWTYDGIKWVASSGGGGGGGTPSDTTPAMDGTGAAGTATAYSRGDHVHPTDTSRYAATNPSGFQTAAQVTTALPVASSTSPVMDGTVAVGVGTTWARSDHVHPTDTSRYAASNPSGFQTAAQVTAVLPTVPALSSTTPAMNGTGAVGTGTTTARADHVHPTDTTRAAVAALPAASSTTPLIAGTAAIGASTAYARADHVHPSEGGVSANQKLASIQFVVDGGGQPIVAGMKGYLEIPFDCTITAVRVFLDQSGSIQFDIYKAAYTFYPPIASNTITASAKPAIASGNKMQDATLTGWTKAVTAGDILGFNVDSASITKIATISLTVTKT